MTVGIVIPSYGYGRYLPELVRSIAQLRPRPAVVTLCDDASRDDSLAIWRKVAPDLPEIVHVQTVIREKNGGTGAALNSAIAVTPTEWVWPIAADDRFKPWAIEELLQVAYSESGGLLCDQMQAAQEAFGVASDGTPLKGTPVRRYEAHADVEGAFRAGKRLSSGCSPFRRVFWEKVGGFDERLRQSEDTLFWVQIARKGARFLPSSRPCVEVRYHRERKSFTGPMKKRERVRMIHHILREG